MGLFAHVCLLRSILVQFLCEPYGHSSRSAPKLILTLY